MRRMQSISPPFNKHVPEIMLFYAQQSISKKTMTAEKGGGAACGHSGRGHLKTDSSKCLNPPPGPPM